MVKSCAAYGCTNRFLKESNIAFHKFPIENKDLCKRWVIAMKRKNFTPNANSFLCSDHFLHDDYNTENAYKRKLKLDAIPSVFAFPERLLSKKSKRKPPARRETETSSPSAKKAKIDLLEESHVPYKGT